MMTSQKRTFVSYVNPSYNEGRKMIVNEKGVRICLLFTCKCTAVTAF